MNDLNKSRPKPTIFQKKNRKGQEEMVGFALIMIIVMVILVVLLSFFLKNSQKEIVESYEVDSFIQAFLQYTTDCRNSLEYLPVQKLIFDCHNNEICSDKRDTCGVLNSTLKEIVEKSWQVGEGRPIQGYELTILVDGKGMLAIKEGNITKNYKGSGQDFSKSGENYELFFKSYY
jgi:hypothetical protein